MLPADDVVAESLVLAGSFEAASFFCVFEGIRNTVNEAGSSVLRLKYTRQTATWEPCRFWRTCQPNLQKTWKPPSTTAHGTENRTLLTWGQCVSKVPGFRWQNLNLKVWCLKLR